MQLKKIGHGNDVLVILGGAGARASLLIPKARTFKRFTCYLLESQAPFEAEAAAHAVMETLKEQGVSRFHLLGVSLGGCVCQALTALYPSSVLSMTLCAAFPALSGEEKQHFERLLSLRETEDDAFLSLWKALLYGASPLPAGPFPLPEKDAFCRQMRAVLSFDHTRFPPPSCPVFVTAGAEDALIFPESTRALCGYLGGEFRLLPGGHLHFLAASFPNLD